MKIAASTSMFITYLYCLEEARDQAVFSHQLSWVWSFFAVFVLFQLAVFILCFDVKMKGDK